MYDFSIFKKAGISPQVNAIIYGIKHDMLSASAAPAYEEWAIANLGIDGSSELLVSGDDKEKTLKALDNAGYADDGKGEDILRYASLASLQSDGDKLLHDIESIYADFDYPPEMESLIYYMPSDEKSTAKTLLKKYRDFLTTEKERLSL